MSDPLFAKLGTWAATAHAAGWLMAKLDAVQGDVTAMEAASPLVAEALAAGKAYATAYGVPVEALETAGEALVALAQKVAAGPKGAP